MPFFKCSTFIFAFLVLMSERLLVQWSSGRDASFAMGATVTEQWEAEYSKVGEIMHKYASSTKFKSLKGVMVVPDTREVIWLTEKCLSASSGFDDCDFYLQNVQTLMSIEQNPICRRAGGLSFSLDPWDSSDIWGNMYRKVYYPDACASILRSSIAGSTMFDADWDLKQLVNNSMDIGSRIEGFQSVDELVDLTNFFPDEAAQNYTGSTSTATTGLAMTRLWIAVVGIEEAVTPDHSVLYFGNVSIEVKAASVVKNVSTPSGFQDSSVPPPLAYRKFVEIINSRMPEVLRELKSFRQLAQLALAQEAVKFIFARQGVFPDGYLQALDYTLEVPQQVAAVVSDVEKQTTFEVVAQLLKGNSTSNGTQEDGGEEAMQDVFTASGVLDKRLLDETNPSPLQELGDISNYQYACSVVNGSIAHIETLQRLQNAHLLTFNCAQIVDKSDEDAKKDEKEPKDKPPTQPDGIFNERPGLGDPCLPGTVAVWDEELLDYIMFPSAYLFIPGIPRMYNITGDVVVVKWGCTWPVAQDDEPSDPSEPESRQQSRAGGDDGAPPLDDNFAPFTHTHTHFGAYPAGSNQRSRRIQLEYNVTLPGHTDAQSIGASDISLRGKVVLVMMPRSWDTLPTACDLPHLLRELQTEWVFGSDGIDVEKEVDLDGPVPVASTARAASRHSSVSVGTERSSGNLGHSEGRPDIAAVVLVHNADFIIPVVEIDSGYLGDSALDVPVRMMAHNYGTELAELVQSSPNGVFSSLACGISRSAEVTKCNATKTEEEEEDQSNLEFSFEFGKSTYRTLDAVNINGKNVGCQSEYMPIPEGYELVPALPEILTYVVGKFTWGTDKLILADMNAYLTATTTTDRPGKLVREIPVEWDSGSIPNPHNYTFSPHDTVVAIRPSACSSRILIRTKGVMVPYGGFFYHTLDLAEIGGTSSSCQLTPIVLPEWLDVAPAISDVINNIVAPYGWSTDALILQDRRGYYTSRAGSELAGKMCCDRQELLFVADRPRSYDYSNNDSSSADNSSVPHWRDTEQVLSVLRCNTRVLVRQPIVAFNKNVTAAPSSLHVLDLRKTTQALSINITRISSGPSTRRAQDKPSSGNGTFRAKLPPGSVASHMYSLSMKLSYSQFTHGGVDLMNIKVTRMAEVPAEVLQQLQERVQSPGAAHESIPDDSSDGENQSSGSNPTSPQDDGESASPLGQSIHAAGSKELGGQFALDFQEKRNSWGKRLGAAMDHLDNHLLGNVAESAEGSSHAVDFIYRPSSFAAIRERREALQGDAPVVQSNDAAVGAFVFVPAPHVNGEGAMALRLLQERVGRLKVLRRRYFVSTTGGVGASNGEVSVPATSAPAARAVSALLIETVDSRSTFLLHYQDNGLVTALLVRDIRSLDASADGVVSGSITAVVRQVDSTDFGMHAAIRSVTETWKLQQRWTEVAVSRALTVANLLRHMQIVTDARGVYDVEENNSHMCQEDGRRFLGLTVEMASALQL